MGLFNTILNGLGFRQEGEEEIQVKKETQEKAVPINQQSGEKTTQTQVSINSLVCYAPKSNSDVKKLIDCVKQNQPCIVNLAGLNKDDIKCVLDYLGGAIYALSGMISKLQGDIYVLSPKDVKITAM